MTYAAEIAKLSRTPVALLVIRLDRCGNVFGSAPCTATGEPCYNGWQTCKDRANYTLETIDLKFCSAEAPVPFAGPRPWLLKETQAATEIKDKFSTTARLTFTMHDEPDADVGLDPYLALRSVVPITSYWRKLIARNPNYNGRPVLYYRGVLGMAEEDFELAWQGQLDAITLGNGQAKLEVVDPLKMLADISVPPKLAVKLAADTQAASDSLSFDKIDGLPNAGVLKVGEEIITYTGINTTTRMATGCTRGAHGTVAETHSSDTKASLCVYYPPTNPFDLLVQMLTNSSDITISNPPGAGIAAASVDVAAFAFWRDYPHWDVPYSALVTESTKLDKLFWEVVQLLDCSVWYSEGQQITLRRNMPDAPGTAYQGWSDSAHLVSKSVSVDLNEESRVDQVVLRYDLTQIGKASDETDYQSIDISVNAETTGANSYNKPAEQEILCRWLRTSWSPYLIEEKMLAYIRALTARRLLNRAAAMALVDLEVEIKDGGVRTGQNVRLTTDALLMPDGSPLEEKLFRVVKRNPKGARLAYRLVRLTEQRLGYFAPESAPAYAVASDAEREYGYFSDAVGQLPDGSTGHVYF